MLVLSRQRDESIVIGDNEEIVITVVDVRGDKVRLGIEALKSIPVHRREVFERVKRERRAAEKAAAAVREGDASAEPNKLINHGATEDAESEQVER